MIPYGYYCSSKLAAEKKEYVIPLIHQTVWRLPGKKHGREEVSGGARGAEGRVNKTEDELALDREAAETIVNGKHIIMCIMTCTITY